jgi:hypothetical protein
LVLEPPRPIDLVLEPPRPIDLVLEPPRPTDTPPLKGGEQKLLRAGSAYYAQSAAPQFRGAVRRTEGYLAQLTNAYW